MKQDMFDKNPLKDILSAPDRVYHGLGHVEDLLDLIKNAPVSEKDKELLSAAAWFHDIVYDVKSGSPENEEKSIAFFRNYPTSFNTENKKRIEAIVRATSAHLKDETHDDHLINLFLDFDMHSFGRSYDVFSHYSGQVRDEYLAAGYDKDLVASGQASFLEKLLAKDKIYRTEYCASWENPARENIKKRLLEEKMPSTAKTPSTI